MNKILFLDRDGVINIDSGHVYKINDFIFVKDIFLICKKYQDEGFKIVIITNQAGIAKKLYSLEDFYKLNIWMINRFNEHNIDILDIFYCPHLPEDNCFCRKPKSGMFIDAINKYNCDIANSIMVGDKISDLIAASGIGIRKLFLLLGKYPEEKVNISYIKISELKEMVEYI